MLPIPVGFIESNVHSYQQTCKRAKNVLDFLVQKRYVISEKKWLRTRHYEVNVFGEIKHIYGSTENVIERMLEKDYISTMDYQLLKFYDMSKMIDMCIDRMMERRVDDLVMVNSDEIRLLYDIGSFAEDPLLTKEEILIGEGLR